jgi:hypothetical protein
VDQAAFAGQPVLSVVVSGFWPKISSNLERPRVTEPLPPHPKIFVGRAAMSLTGGLYPGTSIQADFTLNITRIASIGVDGDAESGSVSLTSTFLNLSTQGSLDAISGVTQAGHVPAFSLQLANQGTVTSAGGAVSTVTKPGSFSVAATGIASATLLGEAAVSVDSLSITVIPVVTSSLFQVTPPLRSAISFSSSGGVRTVPPPSSQTLLGGLTKVVDLFTSVDVELGVVADVSAVCAFFFGGSSSGTQFQLQLSNTIVDQNGNPRHSLCQARFKPVSLTPMQRASHLRRVSIPRTRWCVCWVSDFNSRPRVDLTVNSPGYGRGES